MGRLLLGFVISIVCACPAFAAVRPPKCNLMIQVVNLKTNEVMWSEYHKVDFAKSAPVDISYYTGSDEELYFSAYPSLSGNPRDNAVKYKLRLDHDNTALGARAIFEKKIRVKAGPDGYHDAIISVIGKFKDEVGSGSNGYNFVPVEWVVSATCM